MAEKLRMTTKPIVADNIDFIASRFPNVILETVENGNIVKRIDFEALQQELSFSIIEGKQERYHFTWPDRKQAILSANLSTTATLRPLVEKSVDFGNTKNIYIEGDNLEALRLLRETYLGRVKMIYIDPPYNTGNDFIYEDDFSEGSELFAKRQGDYDDAGNRLVANSNSEGRFHTNWLNMMYPRLKLARDFLSEDGVIFISIDENELFNLYKLCEQVFGEQNFVSCMSWKSKSGGANDARLIASDTEYILAFAKNISATVMFNDLDAEVTTSYNQVDEDGRKYALDRLDKQSLGYHESLDFPIVGPDGRTYVVEHKNPANKVARWRWGKETVQARYNELVFKWPYVYTKNYQKEDGALPRNLLVDDRFGRTRTGKTEVAELFNKISYFDFPKPTKLIKYLISISSKNEGDIIFDFFSGSATTGHAVFIQNDFDHIKRRFILVQLPETTEQSSKAYKDGYHTICDFGEERLRRAGKSIQSDSSLLFEPIDIGFRVFRIDSSNLKDVFYNPQKAKQSLIQEDIDNIKPDRTSYDLLFQVMLELGADLSSVIKEEIFSEKQVFIVGDGYLVACFASNITEEIVRQIAEIKPVYIVFRDSSFETDADNINCEQLIKAISPSTELKVL